MSPDSQPARKRIGIAPRTYGLGRITHGEYENASLHSVPKIKTGGLYDLAPPVKPYYISLLCPRNKPALNHDFGNLHRVKSSPFSQLVPTHPQI